MRLRKDACILASSRSQFFGKHPNSCFKKTGLGKEGSVIVIILLWTESLMKRKSLVAFPFDLNFCKQKMRILAYSIKGLTTVMI